MEIIIWLLLMIILIVVEIFTMGLTTIWFAGGALLAFAAAALGFGIAVQVVLFIAVSLILLLVTRPIALKYLNKRTVKTNVDSMTGRIAVVTESINNLKGTGRAEVDGMPWTVRSADGGEIPAGARVRVQRIDGVKLIVERLKEDTVC